ncbi:MAG: PHP domain-containing protein [Clostridia bacterium]|nr:PHP domain-containing protein [Clostridia bacterium]
MIQDLHSHTYYSFCGQDVPEAVVEAAMAGGVQLLGITDHCHGVGFCRKDARRAPEDIIPNVYGEYTLRRYFDHINLIREKYADRIRILRGIEIATVTEPKKYALPEGEDISFFDYCLIEHLDQPEKSIARGDLFAFAQRCGCPTVGVAHTDLFAFIKTLGEDPSAYFRRMAERNIFWELNVNRDSTHHYREHAYVKRFFESEEQQDIVRRAGVRLSVGFDGHKAEEYDACRVVDACRRLTDLEIKMAFEE